MHRTDGGSIIIILFSLVAILPSVFSLFKYLRLNKSFEEEFYQDFCSCKKRRDRTSSGTSSLWHDLLVRTSVLTRNKSMSIFSRKPSSIDTRISVCQVQRSSVNRGISNNSTHVELRNPQFLVVETAV